MSALDGSAALGGSAAVDGSAAFGDPAALAGPAAVADPAALADLAAAVDPTAPADPAALAEYYANLPKEFGFHSKCKMTLIGDLRGKRVLDVDCRRGKGVFKLSERVGQDGTAVGVDPSFEWIDIARSLMDDAWRKSGLPRNNMDFRVAYPENLAVAGLHDAEFDVVFANSSFNLAYDPEAALAEFYRVLRPGGIFLFDGVVAEQERDKDVVAGARVIGNSIQSALSRHALDKLATTIGFCAPEYHEEHEIAANIGFKDNEVVPVVEADENATFTKTTALFAKPHSR